MASSSKLNRIPPEYQPISMWGYFGYGILFQIPIIGWIFVIIFALTAGNINLRNFARSQFCLMIIWIVLFLISAASGLMVSMLHGVFPGTF